MTAAIPTPALEQTVTPVASGGAGPSPEVVRQIDWDDIVPRVIGYSNYRASLYGEPYKSRAVEYALEAFELFLEGTRHFTPSPRCSAFQFFCGTVKSLISHDVEKAGRRGKEVSIVNTAGEKAPAGCIDGNLIPSYDDSVSRMVFNDKVETFFKSLDPDLQAYARLKMEVDQTAAEYAAALGKTEDDIRNLEKRLKRRRMKWTSN